jgi:hypothetical protein
MRTGLNALLFVSLFVFVLTDSWGRRGASSSTNLHAHCYVIDDFSGNAINIAKWTLAHDQAGPDVFSQSGGLLKFSVTAGSGALQLTQPCSPGFYTMQFFDYSSTNCEEPSSHKGAFVGLGLGPKDNFVRIIRCQNGQKGRGGEISFYGVFEANYIDKTKGGIRVFYVRTQVTSGRLGLYYDGSKVSFYFNPSPDADTGWRTVKGPSGDMLRWNPHWTESPSLFIRGFDPSGTTRCKIDNVEYRPAPPEAS